MDEEGDEEDGSESQGGSEANGDDPEEEEEEQNGGGVKTLGRFGNKRLECELLPDGSVLVASRTGAFNDVPRVNMIVVQEDFKYTPARENLPPLPVTVPGETTASAA